MRKSKIVEEEAGAKRFRALVENAHEGIVLYNKAGYIKYATSSVKKVIGYSEKDIIGKSGVSFIHPLDVEETRIAFLSLLQKKGKSVSIFQRLRHKKGHYIWAESLLTNFLHIPEINGIVSNFRDITEKKLAEEKERESRKLLETISENVTEGIFMGELGKKFLYVNDAFLRIFGYKSFNELEKLKPGIIFIDPAYSKNVIRDLRNKQILGGIETFFKKKNGEKFWGMLNVSRLTYEGKENCFVGTIRDISREKEAANDLIDNRNFLDNIINTVAAPLFVKDVRHRWVKFNNSFCDLLAKKPDEILGKTDKDLLSDGEVKHFWKIDNEVLRTGNTVLTEEKVTDGRGTVHDILTVKSRYINDDNEKFVIGFITDITAIKKVEETVMQLNANLQGVMESTHESIFSIDNNYRYTAFNKNHKRVMKLLYNANIEVGTDKLKCIKNSKDEKWLGADLRRAMKGHHFVVERKLDYPEYHDRYIQLTYNPVRDPKGNVKGVAIFVSDITNRKQSEAQLKLLNDELTLQNLQLASREEELKAAMKELSERNFELDQLMYKTSHDLRSPLSSIMGLVNLAYLDKNQENREQYLVKIEGRIKKLDEFIRSMLNYARVNRAEIAMIPLNLLDICKNSIRELENLETFSQVKTDIKITGQEIPFKSDALRVNIIFGNIISNAYKYFNGEVKSFIYIRIHITPRHAKVEFRDNGIGIKEEHLTKVFNMFYRATDRSQGSGLGMYIVKQAVERLGGEINVASEYGVGTTIKITLPNR